MRGHELSDGFGSFSRYFAKSLGIFAHLIYLLERKFSLTKSMTFTKLEMFADLHKVSLTFP